jgi:predicted HTH transcriptional regulator
MFGIPIDDFDYPTVVQFLETGAREGIVLEFKSDFPAHLDKTLAALANTFGGVILIGVDETETGQAQLPIAGIELKKGLRERVMQIGLESVYPPIFPEVRVVEFRSEEKLAEPDKAIVVIRVNESEHAPHAVESGTTVYLRVDNISKRIERKATVGEIEWLTNKRQYSLDEKARILQAADRRAIGARATRRTRRRGQLYVERAQCGFGLSPPSLVRQS